MQRLSDPLTGALYNGTLMVSLAALLALSYRPTGRRNPELLLFLVTTAMNCALLFAALHSTREQNPFAVFSFFTPLALAAFAPVRPSLTLLLGLEVLVLYPVSLALTPYPGHLHPWLAASVTLALTVMGAAACQAQRRVWSELDRARLEALDGARAKSEFLANVSHEVRTPLTAILGFSELLLERARQASLPAETLDALGTISRNGEHLLEILNDILDLSKMEAGKLRVERAPCAPEVLVRDVVALMRPRAVARGLELSLELDPALPAAIRTDATRLRQILLNLLGNAIKFTERGGVTLRVALDAPAGRQGSHLAFEVIDTGMGLSEAEQARVFDAFAQADGSAARRFGGTGLGLTISRRLAELLGGELSVTSEPGRGSLFRATVATGPLDAVPPRPGATLSGVAPAPAAPSATALAGRVLLAEDGPDNQKLISALLRGAGLEVDIAGNGRVAVECALASLEADTPYRLILMDMQMPEVDGYTATAELRAAGYAGPILALTAHAMAGDRAQCIEVGCDEYLAKPVRKDDLLSVVGSLLAKPSWDG